MDLESSASTILRVSDFELKMKRKPALVFRNH